MQAYAIQYKVKEQIYHTTVNAKDIKSAKKKIGKKHGYADGRMVKVEKVSVIGYF